jgi:hypothetical protein
MYSMTDKSLDALTKEPYWSSTDLKYLLLAKQIRRAENGRPFNAYVLRHSQNLLDGQQDQQDSFHRFLNFVIENIDQFENESCMQMLVHNGKTPGHWTNFSLMIKDSKLHVFACDSADDAHGDTALEELQKIVGKQANIYKLHPDTFKKMSSKGKQSEDTRVIQTGSTECSRMALYNAGVLAKAGSAFFIKLIEHEQTERYQTLLEANREKQKKWSVIETGEHQAQIKLVKPQVAVAFLPALYGVTQSWKRLEGVATDPCKTIGHSGRTLREWAEFHSKEMEIDGQRKKVNQAITDKSRTMVEHLRLMRSTRSQSDVDDLVNIMQDWTKSAPLKGNQHPIQPSLDMKITRVIEKLIVDCSKRILLLQEKERARPFQERMLAKTKRFLLRGKRRSEEREDLYNLKRELELLKQNLKSCSPDRLQEKFLDLVHQSKLPLQIVIALKKVIPERDLSVVRREQDIIKRELCVERGTGDDYKEDERGGKSCV